MKSKKWSVLIFFFLCLSLSFVSITKSMAATPLDPYRITFTYPADSPAILAQAAVSAAVRWKTATCLPIHFMHEMYFATQGTQKPLITFKIATKSEMDGRRGWTVGSWDNGIVKLWDAMQPQTMASVAAHEMAHWLGRTNGHYGGVCANGAPHTSLITTDCLSHICQVYKCKCYKPETWAYPTSGSN